MCSVSNDYFYEAKKNTRVLASLSINNFVLIDALQIKFEENLSIITGETGAGKSILLGALGLVLGERADATKIKNKDQKCVIEAVFKIKNYPLKAFFEANDLDYEDETLIRREILPNGKSRAFINDTPIGLGALQELSQFLIDVHSQQDAAKLNALTYQIQFIDSLAKTHQELLIYAETLNNLKALEKALRLLKDTQNNKQLAYEYNCFVFNELLNANLKEDELEALEASIETLEHTDFIGQALSEAQLLAETDEFGLVESLQKYKSALESIARFDANFSDLASRIGSLKIEFDDLHREVLNYQEQINLDPQELQIKQERLNLLNSLLQKHHVSTIQELILKRNDLVNDIELVENAEAELTHHTQQIKKLNDELLVLGQKIHQKRKDIIPKLQKDLEAYLHQLGMQNARFSIGLTETNQLFSNGIDQLDFLFSANQGGEFGKMTKVASGGERSRIMLALKAILSNYSNLPTIIFDEIDSGVSGAVANTVGSILQNMAKNMQVIAISHLPQIAAKGLHHYKVYKEVFENDTVTHLKLLNAEERIVEIAEMLGGKTKSASAILHAKTLLQ